MIRDPLFLGIDLGTSQLKLQAIDQSGAPVAKASATLSTLSPQTGWCEQAPAGWWAALISACQQLFDKGVAAERIAAIGLTGQMHGAVFLDATGVVLRPCLIWSDARTTAQVADIQQRIPRRELLAITGNPPNTSFTASKILWVREHEPEVYRRTAHILLPKDYLRLRLTGEYATDVSDASATLLFDLAARDWSAQILDALGISPSLLPPVHESVTVTGAVSVAAAQATGLPAGTPVVAGGGDAECSAFGLGMADASGVALSSIGTSGQIFVVTEQPITDPEGRIHSLCHVIANRWHVMGAILTGGEALRWLREILTPPGAVPPDYDTLTKEAAGVAPGADGLLFLPYLLGERTPHMDPQARAVFFGLHLGHTRAHLVRAVLEGVAFALRDGLEVMRELGIAPTEVRATGGGARSQLWAAIQRDVFDLPLRRSVVDHGAAYGAALLAAISAGAFASVTEAVKSIPLGELSMPDPQVALQYEAIYQRYHRLYPALREQFQQIAS